MNSLKNASHELLDVWSLFIEHCQDINCCTYRGLNWNNFLFRTEKEPFLDVEIILLP